MSRGQRFPVCTECNRNTPRLGETVCSRCQEASAQQDEWDRLLGVIRNYGTDEERFNAIADALEMMKERC